MGGLAQEVELAELVGHARQGLPDRVAAVCPGTAKRSVRAFYTRGRRDPVTETPSGSADR